MCSISCKPIINPTRPNVQPVGCQEASSACPRWAPLGYSGLTEILFIGRDDDAETAVIAALGRVDYTVQRVHTVTEANNLLSKQRFDALLIDFDDASDSPGFDLAQLLGLFLFMPTIVNAGVNSGHGAGVKRGHLLMPDTVLPVVPAIHRRDPRCFV